MIIRVMNGSIVIAICYTIGFEDMLRDWEFFVFLGLMFGVMEWLFRSMTKDGEAKRLLLLDQQKNTAARLEDLRQQLGVVKIQLPPEKIPAVN